MIYDTQFFFLLLVVWFLRVQFYTKPFLSALAAELYFITF